MSATLSRSDRLDDSPVARRAGRPAWRDPRLAVGLLLVTGSVVTGASLLADGDDPAPVLALRAAAAVGTPLEAADLVEVRVDFSGDRTAEHYLDASAGIPEGAVLLRPVGAGELLPRDAVGAPADVAVLDLPLPVAAERVAAGVRGGAVVDVWVSPAEQGGAERLLEAVPVRSVGRAGSGTGLRQVVVTVPRSEHEAVARLVDRLDPQRLLVALRRN